jgi:hypothetical protein
VNRSAVEVTLVPPGVVTVTFTVPVPAGLVAVILDGLTTTTLVAATLPNETFAGLVKFVPVMVTDVPPAAGPDCGETPVTVGGTGVPVSVKLAVAVAPLVAPVAATVYDPAGPAGTVTLAEQSPEAPAVHCPAATPLKVTLTVSFAANPAADAVKTDPVDPDDGLTDKVGVVVNVAVAVKPLACPCADTV